MNTGIVYLTRAGFERLQKEVKFLKGTRRKELSAEIGVARDHGDISENAEYDAAKEAQGMNEKRIAELEGALSRARVLDEMDIPSDMVAIGAKVLVENTDTGEKTEYTLLSEIESDPDANKISISSPIGKGLLCRKENDIAEINVPAGILRYKILKIERAVCK